MTVTGMSPRRRTTKPVAPPSGHGWRPCAWGLTVGGKLAVFKGHPCRVKLPGKRLSAGIWEVVAIEINQVGEWRYTVRQQDRMSTRIVGQESVLWVEPSTQVMSLLERS